MKNSPFDSQEEILFNEWCEVLESEGYIDSFVKNIEDKFEITPKKVHCLTINKKNKCFFALHPLTYKYDFKIIWNIKAKNVFYNNINSNDSTRNCYFKCLENDISYIDIKGEYTRSNRVTDVTFPLIQKVLHHFYDMYVQKVIPTEIFKVLFATDRYLNNDNIYKVGNKKGTNKKELNSLTKFLYDKT